MKVIARRQSGFAHTVEVEGGHTVIVDEPTEVGGSDRGPGPTQLLAVSLAACTAITMEMYAARKEWEIGAVEVDVEAVYDGFTPTSFAVSLRLSPDLTDEQRDRLLAIAGKCPVHEALAGETPVIVSDKVEAI
jgi:putative redox protein